MKWLLGTYTESGPLDPEGALRKQLHTSYPFSMNHENAALPSPLHPNLDQKPSHITPNGNGIRVCINTS
ncbi:MAG: hypothetical protein QOE70_2946 [Chthoniobacter sp.]|jgi:hypothetical protein|nr:hypothetical protein [Chthoniobacter sp.]